NDERYQTNSGRVVNKPTLIPELQRFFLTKTRDEWVRMLEAAAVPIGLINDIAQVHSDPQVIARGVKFYMPHELLEQVPQIQSPMRFSDSPVAYRHAPPTLGAHTHEVLSQVLGYS